ncbi:siderophore ABC transporter substrate-binding protein [Nocardioides sp. GXZ039]|uniref:siderophore ABC transporter substrate-binding protein n=1 Tax=Nocardioides sp. GXZ039 TaxID=3136018 RepID=UPI0030F44311
MTTPPRLGPRKPRRLGIALALTVGAGLALTACGSEDDGDDKAEDKASAIERAGEVDSEVNGDTVTITDNQDRKVEVPVKPETVVVMDWSAIRTLNDFGVPVDAVPQAAGSLPEDLSAYAGDDVPKVGDVFEPDYEAIEAMDPDLVIVAGRSGSPEVVAEFERFAPAVIDMSVTPDDPADTFSTAEERVLQLADIFDVREEAESTMDGLATQMQDLQDEITGADETAMFVQVSDGTIGAYGPGSRFGTIFTDFGYQSTSAPLDEEGSHGEEISQEFFVEYNPDVLFVLDRAKAIGEDQTPALDVLDNELIDSVTAAKDDRISEVDGFAWYLAGNAPSSIQQMIDDVKASR